MVILPNRIRERNDFVLNDNDIVLNDSQSHCGLKAPLPIGEILTMKRLSEFISSGLVTTRLMYQCPGGRRYKEQI